MNPAEWPIFEAFVVSAKCPAGFQRDIFDKSYVPERGPADLKPLLLPLGGLSGILLLFHLRI
jgi:hypothetical protein